jgi:hypothetical protein
MENVMKNWMYRASKFVLTALMVAGVLVAGEAQAAERGCDIDPGDCTREECHALQANVKAPDSCSTPESGLSGCAKLRTCSEMKVARDRWLKCYISRRLINNYCYRGGSFEHSSQQTTAGIKNMECIAKIENNECEEDPEDPNDPC